MWGRRRLSWRRLPGLEVSPAAFAEMGLAAIVALASFAAIGAVVLRLARLPYHSYLPATMFPNAGNIGLPLCLFAFGQSGLALGIAFFAVCAIAQFTIGVLIASGQASFAKVLRTPVIYAVAVSLIFMIGDVDPPLWFANTVNLVGGFAIPLMILALGTSLARLQIRSLVRSLALSLVRIGGGLAVGLALGEIMGLSGAARGVLIIQCAMPVAVFNYLFAQHYSREPEEVAGMVLVSTLISFATLPGLLLLAL